MDYRVRPGARDNQDPLELLEHLELLVIREHSDYQARLVLQAMRDLRARRVEPDLLD